VRRRVVDVEVVVLDVLAVVALVRRHAEQPLLEVRIALVPERRREAQQLVAIADAGDAVLAPAVRLRARAVVGEVAPRVAVLGVVLADRPPRAIGEVRPPPPPAAEIVDDRARAFPLPVLAGRIYCLLDFAHWAPR